MTFNSVNGGKARPFIGRRLEENKHDAYVAYRYYFLWVKIGKGRDHYAT